MDQDPGLASVLRQSLESAAAEQKAREQREQQERELALALAASIADNGNPSSTRPRAPAGARPQVSGEQVGGTGDDRERALPGAMDAGLAGRTGASPFSRPAAGGGASTARDGAGSSQQFPSDDVVLLRQDSWQLPEGHYLRGHQCSVASERAARKQLVDWLAVHAAAGGIAKYKDSLFPPTSQSIGELARSQLQVRVIHSDGTSTMRDMAVGWSAPEDLFPANRDQRKPEVADEVRRIALASAGSRGVSLSHPECVLLQDRIGKGLMLQRRDFAAVASIGGSMFRLRMAHRKPSARDVRQAGLGTCWFVSAMAVACEGRGTIEHILTQKDLPVHGMLQIQLCVGGEWRVVTIDDLLPVDKDRSCLMFTSGRLQQLWPSYVEKALSKLSGSFADAESGGVGEGLRYLTGAPVEHLDTAKCTTRGEEKLHGLARFAARGDRGRGALPAWLAEHCDEVEPSEGELWARLLSWGESGYLVGASCGRVGDDQTPAEELRDMYKLRGLVSQHAYSVLRLVEVPVGALEERFRRKMYVPRAHAPGAAVPAAAGAAGGGGGAAADAPGPVVLRRLPSGEEMEVERVIVLRNPWGSESEEGWNGRYGRNWPGLSGPIKEMLFSGLEDTEHSSVVVPRERALGSGGGSGESRTLVPPPGVFCMAFDDFCRHFGDVDAATDRHGYQHARISVTMPRSVVLDPPLYPVLVVTDVEKSMQATACVSQLCSRMRTGMQIRMAVAESGGASAAAASPAGLEVGGGAAGGGGGRGVGMAGPTIATRGGVAAAKVAQEYGWSISTPEDVGGLGDLGCVVVTLPEVVADPTAAATALGSSKWLLADGQRDAFGGSAGTREGGGGPVEATPQLLRCSPRSMDESVLTDFFLDSKKSHVIIPLSLGPLTAGKMQHITTSLHGPGSMVLQQQMVGGKEMAQVLCARARAVGKVSRICELRGKHCGRIWSTGSDSGALLVVENRHPTEWIYFKTDFKESTHGVQFSRGAGRTEDHIPPLSRQVVQIVSQAEGSRGYSLSYGYQSRIVRADVVAHSMATGFFVRNVPDVPEGSLHQHVRAE